MSGVAPADLARTAREHMLLHFTDMSQFEHGPLVISRGDGCYVYDAEGRRYIDGLSGLYCTNLGHSYGDELGRVAHAQMRELPFTSNWTVAHPRSIELAARIAELAPAGLERVFFTSGGSEAVEAAWKLARQYHAARGRAAAAQGDLAPSRLPRHHAGGAVVHRDPVLPGAVRAARRADRLRAGHRPLPPPAGRRRGGVLPRAARRGRGGDRVRERPTRCAMLIAEPVQNAGGASCRRPATGRAARALRPPRHPAVLG